jgi:hypothetical protein
MHYKWSILNGLQHFNNCNGNSSQIKYKTNKQQAALSLNQLTQNTSNFKTWPFLKKFYHWMSGALINISLHLALNKLFDKSNKLFSIFPFRSFRRLDGMLKPHFVTLFDTKLYVLHLVLWTWFNCENTHSSSGDFLL